jgi:hypothetical protein
MAVALLKNKAAQCGSGLRRLAGREGAVTTTANPAAPGTPHPVGRAGPRFKIGPIAARASARPARTSTQPGESCLDRRYFLAKWIGFIVTGASRIVNSACPSPTTFISNLTTSSSSFSSKLSVAP